MATKPLTGRQRDLYIRKIQLMRETKRRYERRLIDRIYPETGLLSRHNYPKHMEFFRAGAQYNERMFMAGNRIGKSFGAGGYETAIHLTGDYPHWWEGAVFDEPVDWWAAGKTNETTRDIIQKILLGNVVGYGINKSVDGTGLIKGDSIIEDSITWRRGVANLIDTLQVKYVTGGFSTLGIKSYEQGRGSFEGTAKDGIWLDEEPKLDIYTECTMRTMTRDGIIFMTFTPLEGMSNTVMAFLPNGLEQMKRELGVEL